VKIAITKGETGGGVKQNGEFEIRSAYEIERVI